MRIDDKFKKFPGTNILIKAAKVLKSFEDTIEI